MGLSRNLNTSILTSTIKKKGPTVATIRVFPSRADACKVMLRINVYDDGYAEDMLCDDFWPSYVTCKRWCSRSGRVKRPAMADRYHEVPPRFRREGHHNGYELMDTFSNRYSPLIEEVD